MSTLTRVAKLSPFGPIFAKELRATSRRKRSYALRVAYLGLLLLTMLMAYAGTTSSYGYGGIARRAEQQAQLGKAFFMAFGGFCVVAMGLIGPVLTATAVGSERLQKTLPVLLMTPISTWQILGGKLCSRLLAAMTLIGLSLPVLALVRLLGGVEIEQMFAVLCICAAFATSSAAIGLFLSTLMNRAYAVILLGYAASLFLYLLVPFLLIYGLELKRNSDAATIAAINPVFCTFSIVEPQLGRLVGASWPLCVAIQLALTAVLLAASGLILRRMAHRAGEQPAAVSPESYIPLAAAIVAPPEVAGDAGAAGSPVPPPLPADRTVAYESPRRAPTRLEGPLGVLFWRPFYALAMCFGAGPWSKSSRITEVGDNPILWRELRRPLLPKVWQRVVAAVACVGLLLTIYGIMAHDNDLDHPDAQIAFAFVFHGLMWLLVSVFAATAIASEKEGDTWTVLLASPVSGSQLVWGKVAGLLRRLVWPTVLIVAHFSLFVLGGVIHPMAVPLVLWVMLSFNSIWLATGLYLSLRMRKVTFAVITNLMLAVLLYAVPPVLLAVFSELTRVNDDVVQQVGWYTPYWYIGPGMEDLNRGARRQRNWYQANMHDEFSLPGYWRTASAGAFAAAVAASGCVYLLLSYLILSRTAAGFDRIVGRAGRDTFAGGLDARESVFATSAPAPAGVGRRAAALIVDAALVGTTCAAAGLVTGVIIYASGAGGRHEQYLAYQRGRVPITAFANTIAGAVILPYVGYGLLAAIVVGWPYFAGFESAGRGATPGKRLAGVFVTDAKGRRLSFWRASWRYAARFISAALLLWGFLRSAWSAQGRTLHDELAGTLVLSRSTARDRRQRGR